MGEYPEEIKFPESPPAEMCTLTTSIFCIFFAMPTILHKFSEVSDINPPPRVAVSLWSIQPKCKLTPSEATQNGSAVA